MSKIIEVKAVDTKTGKECTVTWDTGNGLQEKIQMFGEAVVDAAAEAQFKVSLRPGLKASMIKGTDPQIYADAYKPGIRAPSIAQDPMSAAKSAYSRMSSEEKAAFLESLKA